MKTCKVENLSFSNSLFFRKKLTLFKAWVWQTSSIEDHVLVLLAFIYLLVFQHAFDISFHLGTPSEGGGWAIQNNF